MYKRVATIVFLILLVVYLCLHHLLVYIYVCPYIYTDGFKYVAKPIKLMTTVLRETKKAMAKNGIVVKVRYQNAYGSGFLKNNPIPNDLDYLVGVNLGEFDYNGENADEIAKVLTNKICTFEPLFSYHASIVSNKELYSAKSFVELVSIQPREKVYKCIKESLDNAVAGESYVKDTLRLIPVGNENREVHVPYMMRPHEILLDNYESINLYGKNIVYHKHTPNYLRELMVVFEYSFTLNQEGKKVEILIVPESAFGARLQLARKFFVSNTFVSPSSADFIKNYPAIKNDDEYFFYRLFSFRRHLLEVENIIATQDRPHKILKRLMQTADSIAPILSDELYNEIGNFVNSHLGDKKDVFLNEISYIIGLYWDIVQRPYIYYKLVENGELKHMYMTMSSILDEMPSLGFDKSFVYALREYQESYMKLILNGKDFDTESYSQATELIKGKILETLAEDFMFEDNLNRYVEVFHKIFIDAGYQKVSAYWLDGKTLALVENDFTRKIDDFSKFARENSLPLVDYKLISEKDIKYERMRHDMWVRYNSTDEENKNYEILKQALLEDKKNFNLKYRIVFL